MDGIGFSMLNKHTLNKDKFLNEMQKRGWTFSDSHGWLAPTDRSNTKQSMEQAWVDAIVASVDCPFEEHSETLGDA
jgi:hypothetical protein